MAYNEKLTERVRTEFGEIPFVEKKMFGGVGFLIYGNMACGVYKNDLIIRFDPQKYDKLFRKVDTKPFDITGRPMKGWLMVEPAGCKTTKQFSAWIKEGTGFALTLPPK